jgi:NAD(P)H dehydrogenase (quinone)
LWRDKLAAGFTVSNSPGGGKFNTLQYFFTPAMRHGMIWIGLGEHPPQAGAAHPVGSFSSVLALAGQEPVDITPNAADKLTGEIRGRRVASFVLKLTI